VTIQVETAKQELTESQQRLSKQQVEVFWAGVPPKIIHYAMLFGAIELGWTCKDYILHAGRKGGYETIGRWGERGGGKSNRTLLAGYWVYGDWDVVFQNLVFKPTEFVRKLKTLPKNQRCPWLGWDDVGVHMPSTVWRTDIKVYEAVDAAWAGIRTKVSNVDLSIPLIDRFAKNIKDSLTFEVFMGRNQAMLHERYVRLPNIEDQVESNFRKVQIEPIYRVDLFEVPRDVFKQYWNKRLELEDEALDRLDRTLTKAELEQRKGDLPNEPENYISLMEAAKLLSLSPFSLTHMCDKGWIRTEIIERQRKLHRDDIIKLKENIMERKAQAQRKRLMPKA